MDTMAKLPISVCIITFNEEKNIVDCLESVNWVDEIVVVDSLLLLPVPHFPNK